MTSALIGWMAGAYPMADTDAFLGGVILCDF